MSIKQPRNQKNEFASLVWKENFRNERQKEFNKTQSYIDSECIRLMKPFTPFKNGQLERSATLGTQIGSGLIMQTAPYARYQYYGMLMVSSKTGSAWSRGESKVLTNIRLNHDTSRHALAGSYWFERMKAVHKKNILKGAKKIAGGQ